MPFVHVRVTRDTPEGATREQKARVIAEITDTLQRVLGKAPSLTHVVIDEIATDDWGWGGETTTAVRARETARDDAGVVPLPSDAGRR